MPLHYLLIHLVLTNSYSLPPFLKFDYPLCSPFLLTKDPRHTLQLVSSVVVVTIHPSLPVTVGRFEDNFVVSGLGRSLDVLLEEGVDVLVTVSAVANFD